VNLDLLNTTNPFGTGLLATVADLDGNGSSQPWEQQGTASCTYEPSSNTGVVIVRHLLNSAQTSEFSVFSLIDTGIFP
jgi:hypothetical protein